MARFLVFKLPLPGVVINAVEWDGNGAKWQPPTDHDTVQSDREGNPGDIFDGSRFIPAPVVIREPMLEIADVSAILLKRGTITQADIDEQLATRT